jgi:glycerophosphoryl diester phosphodiesterase
MMRLLSLTLAGAGLCMTSAPVAAGLREPSRSQAIRQKFADANGGIMVVAHRGCHNPAPRHGLPAAPENSLTALDHCLRIGADMMETDVRRTADGYLVIIHDDTVDRTTNGTGKVAEMTLAQMRQLRLRQNLGGPTAAVTDQRVLTLDELLSAAKGRIILNLDVKDASFPETVAAVLRGNAQQDVILKSEVGIGSPAMAATPPYAQVSFMPILGNAAGSADLGAIAMRQLANARPVAFELPHMTASQLPAIVAVAESSGVRLLMNTLGEGFLAEAGGDVEALRDPARVWGEMFRQGVTVFQTDEPEALLAYRTNL